MATLNEVIYILKNETNDYANQYKVSNRQYEFMINFLRSTLVKRDQDKGKTLSSNVLQNLGVVPVQRINRTDDGTIKLGGEIIQTLTHIPHPIETNNKDVFTYIGGLDRISPFEYSNRAYSGNYSRHNKYTADLRRSYYRDGRIYITGGDILALQSIWIEGVFEDPREVWTFKQSQLGNTCAPAFEDEPYPISEYMIEAMTTMIKKGELDMKFVLPRNNVNDAEDPLPNESTTQRTPQQQYRGGGGGYYN